MLLLGSHNPHKREELQALLEEEAVTVVGLERLPDAPEPAEHGTTFEENAAEKARAYACRAAALPESERPRWVIGDDSGLCVDALDGAPGIRSARYAGPEQNDAANIRKLLENLRDVPPERRSARFVCTIACARVPPPGGEPEVAFTVRGTCEGRIAASERGGGGFGYDPVFEERQTGRTFAEMSPEEKNRRSHRGLALEAFRKRFHAELHGP